MLSLGAWPSSCRTLGRRRTSRASPPGLTAPSLPLQYEQHAPRPPRPLARCISRNRSSLPRRPLLRFYNHGSPSSKSSRLAVASPLCFPPSIPTPAISTCTHTPSHTCIDSTRALDRLLLSPSLLDHACATRFFHTKISNTQRIAPYSPHRRVTPQLVGHCHGLLLLRKPQPRGQGAQ